MRHRWAALLLTTLAACQTGPAADEGRVVIDLVFGRSIPGGETVSDRDWQTFVDEVLVRKTPGFTAMDCQGGWLDGGTVVREDCRHVLVLADRPALPALRDAVTEYRRRFRQDSVLWMERACDANRCRLEDGGTP